MSRLPQGACAGAAQQERSAASYAPSADFSYDPPGRNHLFVPGNAFYNSKPSLI